MARTADGTEYDLVGPDHAPVVVLIHGLGLRRASWQWTVPALQDHFRVLTYDLYGHGDSADPPETPSLTLFARQLASLLDHCDAAKASITGFSLGGMIARRFAQDHADRTAALAILNSPHQRDDAAQAAIRKRVEQARTEGPQATVEAALDRWFTEGFRASNPDIMDVVRHWVLSNQKEIYPTIYKVFAEGVTEIVRPDPPITCPTLVLTADEDFGNNPAMTHAIAADIAGSQTVVLPGLRHMALAENPEAVNTPLVTFLKTAVPSVTARR